MPYFTARADELRMPLLSSTTGNGLRAAQIAAAQAVASHFFANSEPALVVMPTGSGKTCVMMLVAILLRARRALVLTPSRMVRDQLRQAFEQLELLKKVGALPITAPLPRVREVTSRMSTLEDWQSVRDSDVVVGTVPSCSPQIDGVATPPTDLFDLVLCDEAHHEQAPTWRALLDHFSDAKRVLFTATPFRRDLKILRARVVFEYPLAQARDDGVFGTLQYVPVEPSPPDSADVALAQAAEELLKAERAQNFPSLVLVRTSQASRAKELHEIYSKNTSLRLKTLLGSHATSRMTSIVQDMKDGKLDGVICVDMLGEGFDLPNLKIGVLHSPHKSLAVTLQFIGRFARTTGTSIPTAKFLAVPSEIEVEANRLYVAGAEWNELVERASRERIDAEREARNVVESFAPVSPPQSRSPIDVSALTPFFHVKVFDVGKNVDLTRALALPRDATPLLLTTSEEHSAVICVTETTRRIRWFKAEGLSDVFHDLHVIFHDEPNGFLFIGSSRRDFATYDALARSVVVGDYRRLSPEEANRVLRGLKDASFFSIGMRNKSGLGSAESYRMISGSSADKAIQSRDGRFYDRGHCFGKGTSAGKKVTIGFSSSSKIWANRSDRLYEFFKWCREHGAKMASAAAVTTMSGLDHLPVASRLTGFPDHLIAMDWSEFVYAENLLLRAVNAVGEVSEFPLTDFQLEIVTCTNYEVTFEIVGHGFRFPVSYRLDRARWFATREVDDLACVDANGGDEMSLEDFLLEHPPAAYSTELARVEGDSISVVTTVDDFPNENIEAVDWVAASVSPLLEKPAKGGDTSLFEWLQARLERSDATVIFNDDDSYEVADFIALRDVDGVTRVDVYHCKAAAKEPVPGQRVEDLYEVVGQAVKCMRLASKDRMLAHLLRRSEKTKAGVARFVRGNAQLLAELLAAGRQVQFSVTIVQPGVGTAPKPEISALLGAANGYARDAQLLPLRVIGSASTKKRAV